MIGVGNNELIRAYTERMMKVKDEDQPDFFAPAFVDIPIRDQRDLMERPFFSLAKDSS